MLKNFIFSFRFLKNITEYFFKYFLFFFMVVFIVKFIIILFKLWIIYLIYFIYFLSFFALFYSHIITKFLLFKEGFYFFPKLKKKDKQTRKNIKYVETGIFLMAGIFGCFVSYITYNSIWDMVQYVNSVLIFKGLLKSNIVQPFPSSSCQIVTDFVPFFDYLNIGFSNEFILVQDYHCVINQNCKIERWFWMKEDVDVQFNNGGPPSPPGGMGGVSLLKDIFDTFTNISSYLCSFLSSFYNFFLGVEENIISNTNIVNIEGIDQNIIKQNSGSLNKISEKDKKFFTLVYRYKSIFTYNQEYKYIWLNKFTIFEIWHKPEGGKPYVSCFEILNKTSQKEGFTSVDRTFAKYGAFYKLDSYKFISENQILVKFNCILASDVSPQMHKNNINYINQRLTSLQHIIDAERTINLPKYYEKLLSYRK